MRPRARLPFGLGLVLLTGCAGGVKPLAVFEYRVPALTIEIDPARDGVSPVRLSGAELREAVVVGEARADGEGWRIDLRRLDWFNNWPNGWTRASFPLDGSAALLRTKSGWTLSVEKAPELDEAESASIRYFDTYVRGDEGLREFSRRWDRIRAVVGDISARVPDSSEFRDPRRLQRYLFPEIYGYDARPDPAHAKAPAEGVSWNTDYTKRRFAEPLWALRDGGTLLRDYKESPGLWLLVLEWEGFWERSDRSVVPVSGGLRLGPAMETSP